VLLSEDQTAKVVAACVLGKDIPLFETDPKVKDDRHISGKLTIFYSDVHKREINLLKLKKFLVKEMTAIKNKTNGENEECGNQQEEELVEEINHDEHAPQSLIAADLLLKDVDMCSKGLQGTVREPSLAHAVDAPSLASADSVC